MASGSILHLGYPPQHGWESTVIGICDLAEVRIERGGCSSPIVDTLLESTEPGTMGAGTRSGEMERRPMGGHRFQPYDAVGGEEVADGIAATLVFDSSQGGEKNKKDKCGSAWITASRCTVEKVENFTCS